MEMVQCQEAPLHGKNIYGNLPAARHAPSKKVRYTSYYRFLMCAFLWVKKKYGKIRPDARQIFTDPCRTFFSFPKFCRWPYTYTVYIIIIYIIIIYIIIIYIIIIYIIIIYRYIYIFIFKFAITYAATYAPIPKSCSGLPALISSLFLTLSVILVMGALQHGEMK